MRAVVGLGNPGRPYAHTRHNAGFSLIRRVAKAWNVRLKKTAFLSKIAYLEREGKTVMLAMPQTYMNKSGLAVKQMVDSGSVRLADLVIIYDDLDIPLGEVRIREEGGPGTHKGIQSIIEELNSRKFARIRIGIGPMPPNTEATEFVLSAFSAEEALSFEKGLEKAGEALEHILDEEIEKAMTLFNQRPRTEPKPGAATTKSP